MICKVKETIKKYNMPLKGSNVVVALSGGADSMALLDVMYKLSTEFSFTVSACHVNHCIRGAQADSDEKFVKDFCENKGIELFIYHKAIPEIAKANGLGLEECGRRVRYEIFSSFENSLIATAHTLSDKCETLILNETRGTSVKGLSSIPAVRGNIIRPLIDCTRTDIENYCAENNIPFVTDKTNFDPAYSRNRIRLNVIPELKKINPALEESLSRLSQGAAQDEDYFSSVVGEIIAVAKTGNSYNAELIGKQHFAIRRRVIAEILSTEAGITPELIHIKMVDAVLNGGKTEVLGNTVVEVKNGVLCVNPVEEAFFEWERNFNKLTADTPKGKVSARIINKNELPPKQIVHNKVLDFDSTHGDLILRNRRQGDKMRVAGSSCTKTLKKLFTEKHLDARNNRLILADSLGIVWVEGIGCADRCKIKKETEKILLIGEDLQND